jgi:hypothetical protein
LSGPPAIWLHTSPAQTAWIITSVGERDWCRLAYQFGHVLANSWQRDAAPQPPCQWLEEALVEAFSPRGRGLLADSWAQSPPVQGDKEFSDKIRDYRTDILTRYQGYATEWGASDLGVWYSAHRAAVSKINGLSDLVESVVPALLAWVESNPVLIEDYGAMNRWPGRSAVPPAEYLRLWRESCTGILMTPLISHHRESIGEHGEFREHRSEPLGQRQQPRVWHVGDQVVEHAALPEQRVSATFGGV